MENTAIEIGDLLSGDFQDNTLTFEMTKDIVIKAGKYTIIPIEEFEKIVVNAYNKGSHSRLMCDEFINEKPMKGKQYYDNNFKK